MKHQKTRAPRAMKKQSILIDGLKRTIESIAPARTGYLSILVNRSTHVIPSGLLDQASCITHVRTHLHSYARIGA
jgi:hypothetical protein